MDFNIGCGLKIGFTGLDIFGLAKYECRAWAFFYTLIWPTNNTRDMCGFKSYQRNWMVVSLDMQEFVILEENKVLVKHNMIIGW